MKHIFSTGIFLFHIILSIPICFADDVITGHYCFTYGDKESLMEAKALTHTLAIRNAIESYRVYIESTGTVKNFVLTNDIIQILSSGYLRNIKVVDYKEQGRTICETLQATVSPQEIQKVIKKQVQSSVQRVEERGLANNGFLKIIGIEERKEVYEGLHGKRDDQIVVTVKVLKKFQSDDEHGIVFVTFYGADEKEESTTKERVCIEISHLSTSYSHETLYPGEVKHYWFRRYNPDTFIPYKVWLFDDREKQDTKGKR